ncbi:hypothetical protein DRQ15_11370, partial [candidate division KSB1 bacterium]
MNSKLTCARIITPAGNNETAYQFTQKTLDNLTGFYYFGARYYDHSIGRWFVPEPAGQGFSPYVYCGNRPLVMVDPDGQFVFMPFIIAGLFSGAYGAGCAYIDHQSVGRGFVSGFLSGALGYGLPLLTPPGAIPGAIYGSLSGGLVGGITSKISGGSFSSGFTIGAITGGISGGISGYKMAKALGRNPWTGAMPEIQDTPLGVHYDFSRPTSIRREVPSRKILVATGESYLEFDGNNLTWYDNLYGGNSRQVDSWQAVSGPYGNGALPSGIYYGRDISVYNLPGWIRDGVGFRAYLDPQFQLPAGRGGFFIHPDGGVPGTLGCIGLTGNAERLNAFYNRYFNYFQTHNYIRVNV